MVIMARLKGIYKQTKADTDLIVNLEHSASPDAEMRLHQAYGLALQALDTTVDETQGRSGHVRQDPDRAKEGPN